MEKDKSRRSGNGTAKKRWKYFSKIDSIMSQKHIINPPSIVDTMADVSHETLMMMTLFILHCICSRISAIVLRLFLCTIVRCQYS